MLSLRSLQSENRLLFQLPPQLLVSIPLKTCLLAMGQPQFRKKLPSWKEFSSRGMFSIKYHDIKQNDFLNFHLNRDTVRAIMLLNDPDGFDIRDPSRKPVIQRKGHLTGTGVFKEIHCDGHEKLSSKALLMGPVGLDIYGMRCHTSGLVVNEQVVPNSRCEYTIAHCYLDMVEEYGGKLNPSLISHSKPDVIL